MTVTIGLIGVFLLSLGCTTQNGNDVNIGSNASTGKLQVVTSFRPFTLLVKPIVGNKAKITQILPPGANPHSYEPTPNDAISVHNAKVFFYDGPFLEPWTASIANTGNPSIRMVSFANAIPANTLAKMKAEYPNFPNVNQNPHLWLSPQLAEYFVSYSSQQLSNVDPVNADYYNSNAKTFDLKLKKLDADYKKGLSNCTTRTVLTSHSFLDYVASTYNITVISIAGLSPNAEPSISQMVSILNESKAKHVMGILAEPDESIKLSNSIGKELNLTVYTFNTMEILPSDTSNTNEDNDYIAIQEKNLQEMRLALGCH